VRNSDSRRVCQICEWTFSDDCDQQDSKMRLTCLPRWEKFLEIFSRGARPCHRFCGRPRKGAESSRSAPKPTNNRLICFFYNLYLCPRSPLISVPKITLVSGTLFIIFDNTVTVRLTILTEKHVQEVLSCWHWNSPKQDSHRSFVVAQHLSRSAFLSHNYPYPTIILNSVLTTCDTFRSWVQLAAK
jgi:hypothetical protein